MAKTYRPGSVWWVMALLVGAFGLTATRADAACVEPAGTQILISPEQPVAGAPVHLLAITPRPEDGVLHEAGRKLATTRRGGPPPSYTAEITSARAGTLRVELREGSRVLACRSVEVKKRAADRERRKVTDVYWPTTRSWDAVTEGLYAAWVESLFDAPASEALSFRPLAPALQDPKRNWLYDHLGLGEDDPTNREVLWAEPDCADLPFYLRTYFAWKLGLPMGFRDCGRGTSGAAPTCGKLITNQDLLDDPAESSGKASKRHKPPKRTVLGVMRRFVRKLANTVHSGSARTRLDDETTDLYPVPLEKSALRPGTVYADPYGHVLVLVKWVPPAEGKGGLLFAVDGQPDGSVARKRFWEGTFLYAPGDKSAGPGWKAFRPLVADETGALVPAGNEALGDGGGRIKFASEPGALAPEAFYARMGKLINPKGLAPEVAYQETLAALVEQLETRVGSVDNGETNAKQTSNALIEMPEGPKIFETVGPWEDFATPSRDMRLIIAMNVLNGLPARIEKHPELFVLGGKAPGEARKQIEALHARLVKERSIEYKRSDGSAQKLTVGELLARKAGFEIAYNPNDCVEHRWAAPAGSPELGSCQRRVPPAQQARMEQYRSWFREAKRPPR